MSEVKKCGVGKLAVKALVIVASFASIYTAIQTYKIESRLEKLQSIGNKPLSENQLESAIKAVSEKETKAKYAQVQSTLYKGWDKAGDSKDGHHIYGSPTARFTLINYSDFECPFCKRFHETPKYLVDSAKNGMVNWEWRHFPLSFHEPMASKAAVTSECVAQQKGSKGFWAFSEYWFSHTAGNGQGFADSENIPEIFGLDKVKFNACLTDPSIVNKVKADMKLGNDAGVNGTPATVIVDNETGKTETVVGAQPFEKFVQVIENMAHPQPQVDPTGQPDAPASPQPNSK